MATPHESTAGNNAHPGGSPAQERLKPLDEDPLPDTDPTLADTQGLAQYIDELAQGISQLAHNLRHQNADQALQQAGRMAQDNPALFLLGSMALGFGLSRVFRSDTPHGEDGMTAAPDGDMAARIREAAEGSQGA